jgi:hypothetical protein
VTKFPHHLILTENTVLQKDWFGAHIRLRLLHNRKIYDVIIKAFTSAYLIFASPELFRVDLHNNADLLLFCFVKGALQTIASVQIPGKEL